MKTIGLVPGAMKPFHAGHNYIVQQSIKECDEVIIFTSPKDRGIIDGKKMLEAWNTLILPLLLYKAEIVSVASPIRGVYDYLDSHGTTENTYRIYGGTEDIARLNKARLLKYHPHLNAINVAEENPDQFTRGAGYTEIPAKGAWVRESIKVGDHRKFRSFLPKFLKPHAKEYLKILTS